MTHPGADGPEADPWPPGDRTATLKALDSRHKDERNGETPRTGKKEQATTIDTTADAHTTHTRAHTLEFQGFLRQHRVGDMTRSTEPQTDAEANKHSS